MLHSPYKASLALMAVVMLAGCSGLEYYGHLLSGQMEIVNSREPIDEVIADPDTDDAVRERLATVQDIRQFAVAELSLPDTGSYRTYVDLERPYVLWNVFATPELSLEQKQWCYPIVGCMTYRTWFDRGKAEAYAERLEAQGYDVYIGNVAAYSTLGWFDDPLYSTLLTYSEAAMAGVMFHELAHEQLYVPDDTTFNESFATTVQLEGARRWLEHTGRPEAFGAYLESRQQDDEFVALLMRYRDKLEALYGSDRSDDEKRAQKQALLAQLLAEYEQLKRGWGGYAGYDAFFYGRLNNAALAPVGTYHQYVPAFRALLQANDGDFAAFYAAVAQLGELDADGRAQHLDGLLLKHGVTGP